MQRKNINPSASTSSPYLGYQSMKDLDPANPPPPPLLHNNSPKRASVVQALPGSASSVPSLLRTTTNPRSFLMNGNTSSCHHPMIADHARPITPFWPHIAPVREQQGPPHNTSTTSKQSVPLASSFEVDLPQDKQTPGTTVVNKQTTSGAAPARSGESSLTMEGRMVSSEVSQGPSWSVSSHLLGGWPYFTRIPSSHAPYHQPLSGYEGGYSSLFASQEYPVRLKSPLLGVYNIMTHQEIEFQQCQRQYQHQHQQELRMCPVGTVGGRHAPVVSQDGTTSSTIPPPQRPMSAFNFFFSDERCRILNSTLPDETKKDRDEEEGDKNKNCAGDDDKKYCSPEDDGDRCSPADEQIWSEDYGIPIGYPRLDKEKWQNHVTKILQRHDKRRDEGKKRKRVHKKTNGVGFTRLIKIVSSKWKKLPGYPKKYYEKLGLADSMRYEKKKTEYDLKLLDSSSATFHPV